MLVFKVKKKVKISQRNPPPPRVKKLQSEGRGLHHRDVAHQSGLGTPSTGDGCPIMTLCTTLLYTEQLKMGENFLKS